MFYLYERGYALTVVAGISGSIVPVGAGSPAHATIGYVYRLSISTFECPRHNRVGILGHLKASDSDRIADLNGNASVLRPRLTVTIVPLNALDLVAAADRLAQPADTLLPLPG